MFESIYQEIKNTAREEIIPRYQRVSATTKSDGSLVTEADMAVQERLRSFLLEAEPGAGFLSEEMLQTEQLLALEDSQTLWILDPLDGTSNFTCGIPFFCISLALYSQGKIKMGCIYDPIRDELFTAEEGKGAFLNGDRLNPHQCTSELKSCVAIIDMKRVDITLKQALFSEKPFHSHRSFGSVALEWCWLAAGRGQLYLHGSQKLWDYSAAHLILSEVGGYCSTLEGEPVFNKSLDPRSSVAALNQVLFNKWYEWIGSHSG